MQEVSEQSVLADFTDAHFEYAGITTEFYRKDGRFMIRTDGPDGELDSYPVAYVFGYYPLQQYLLELPGGRLQAFGIAWDSRIAEEGGQRWFHLYPDEEITHRDAFHWTKRSQNWNFMCAECHSTNLDKNYQSDTRTYETRWSEIDVSCEACHGPGSNHLLWADESQRSQYNFFGRKGLTHLLDERKGIQWNVDEASGKPLRSRARRTETEIQVCAACHSRRSQFFEDDRRGQELMESFLPAVLEEGLYHSDGQVNGEVYVYGSFLQSRMYHAGVTCSDCHDPHSLKLNAVGDDACMQCHSPEDYASSRHHHHEQGEDAPGCIDCHMPAKKFMIVDERRDHSFRIPRPDLSAALGVPNTCNSCHANQTAQWAAARIHDWYDKPDPGFQQFAEILYAARNAEANAKQPLQSLAVDMGQPAIVRATAARLLESYLDQSVIETLSDCLADPNPLVRVSTARSLSALPPEFRWQLLKPLLKDNARVVRTIATEVLADIPISELAFDDRQLLELASQEYIESQKFSADTPESLVNLGSFFARRNLPKKAENAYLQAIEIDDSWIPVYVNLADLYRQSGQDDTGRELLEETLRRFPDSADLHHSLGLLHIRQRDQSNGLAHLERAAELAPQNARYQFVYAVGLHSIGQTQEALDVTRTALENYNDNDLMQLNRQLENELDMVGESHE